MQINRYSSSLYVDIQQETFIGNNKVDMKTYSHIYLGKIPMMLRSAYCWTGGLSPKELIQVHECVYDKVIILV